MWMKSSPSPWKKTALRNQQARTEQTEKGKTKSTRFGVGALFDLLQAGIRIADPIASGFDIAAVHWSRPTHFFGPRDDLVANFYRLGLRRFPMAAEFAERVI